MTRETVRQKGDGVGVALPRVQQWGRLRAHPQPQRCLLPSGHVLSHSGAHGPPALSPPGCGDRLLQVPPNRPPGRREPRFPRAWRTGVWRERPVGVMSSTGAPGRWSQGRVVPCQGGEGLQVPRCTGQGRGVGVQAGGSEPAGTGRGPGGRGSARPRPAPGAPASPAPPPRGARLFPPLGPRARSSAISVGPSSHFVAARVSGWCAARSPERGFVRFGNGRVRDGSARRAVRGRRALRPGRVRARPRGLSQAVRVPAAPSHTPPAALGRGGQGGPGRAGPGTGSGPGGRGLTAPSAAPA